MWQDKVFALCQLAFFPSMIPTLIGADKPPLSTCVMNSVIVALIAVTQATLSLWLSVSTSIVMVGVWSVLAAQKFRLAKARPPELASDHS